MIGQSDHLLRSGRQPRLSYPNSGRFETFFGAPINFVYLARDPGEGIFSVPEPLTRDKLLSVCLLCDYFMFMISKDQKGCGCKFIEYKIQYHFNHKIDHNLH